MDNEMFSIDVDRLRSDMQDECMGACFGGGFGGALFEAFNLGSASDDEIIRRAYNQGIDLNDYME